MIKGGNEEAALCGVEHGGQDHCDGQDACKVRPEGPGALGASAEKECRQMPQAPDSAQDQTGPEGSIAALQKGQGQAAPAQLLNGPYDQPRGQGGQDGVPGGEGEGIVDRALDGSAQIEGGGYAYHQQGPPIKRHPPKCEAAEEEFEAGSSAASPDQKDTGYGRRVHRQDEKRIGVAHGAENGLGLYRKEDQEGKDSPSQCEGDGEEWNQGSEVHVVR